MAREQLSRERAKVAAAGERAAEAEADALELTRLREQLVSAREQLVRAREEAAAASARAAQAEQQKEELSRADPDAASLAGSLVEAKLAAAQNAFERDEARARAKGLRDQLERAMGGSQHVARHATKLEVKLEEQYHKEPPGGKCPSCGYSRGMW